MSEGPGAFLRPAKDPADPGDSDDLAGRASRAAVWSAVLSLTRWGSALPVFLVLARYVPVEDFGVFAVASVVILLAQLIVDMGLPTALIQRRNLEPAHCTSAFWWNAVLGCLLAGGVALTSHPLADFFGMPRLAPVLVGMALLLIVDALGLVPVALLSRDLRLKGVALRSLVAAAAASAVAVGAAIAGLGVWALVLQQLVYSGTGLVAVWLIVDWRPALSFSWGHLRQLLAKAAPVSAANLLIVGYRRSDDLLIGKFLDAASLGVYSVAYRLILLLNEGLLAAIGRVTLPAFSRAQDDPDRVRRAVIRAASLSATVTFPVFAVMTVMSGEIVTLAFGDQWSESAPVLAALAPAGFAYALAFIYFDYLLALGHARVRLGLYGVRSIVHLMGFIVGLRWGVVGVGLSFTVSSTLLLVPDLWVVRRVTGLSLRRLGHALIAPSLATIAGAAACLIGPSLGADLPAVLRVTMGTLFGGSAYLAVLGLLRPGLIRELWVLTPGRGTGSAGDPAAHDAVR